jgi:regulator of protease activity HflC (stomatin/prohibitin superfamily)
MSKPEQAQMIVTDLQHSPAYRAFFDANLICDKYLVKDVSKIDVVPGTWDATCSMIVNFMTCNGGCMCQCCITKLAVNSGNVVRAVHQSGAYSFLGQGIHMLPSLYVSAVGGQEKLTAGTIVHGTKAIITVPQGFVGLATDQGHPMLLPPGLHQWDSGTINFDKLVDLSTNVISLGPYTLVTVDENYAAVTQDNGKLKVLGGGKSYMLTHRNWKFEKYLSMKLQQDDVPPFTITTGDNIPLDTVVNVTWVIHDAELAARMAANTIGSGPRADGGINEFREDVHRQVRSSLATFAGSIRYGLSDGATQISQKTSGEAVLPSVPSEKHVSLDGSESDDFANEGRAALFNSDHLKNSVEHANEICQRYGVQVLSINLISATPSDRQLLEALSQGAVASVAAQQTHTAAKAKAQATLIQASAEAEATMVKARGEAEAEKLRAEGSLSAAKSLEGSNVAVALSRIRTTGTALGEGKANSFFFGLQGAGDLPMGLLAGAMAS